MEDKILNQAQFMRWYNDNNREHFNMKLFERNDDEIIEELKKVILSCQRDKYFTIKVTKFTVIEDYATILQMLRDQEAIKSDSKDKSINKYDYITLKDSAIKLLVVDYYLAVPNPKKDKDAEKNLRVLIMVPRFVDKYYFKIFGNYYFPRYQIVDGSTYNNSQSNSKNPNVTLKSLFMATRLYRYQSELKLANSTMIPCVLYSSRIFDKSVPVLKYILAKYGMVDTMNALGVTGISFYDELPSLDPEEYYTFKKHNIYVSVPKFLYDNDIVLQSLVYTIIYSIDSKEYNAEMLWTIEFWCRSLGGSFDNKSVEKGKSVLDSLESIYDIPTKLAIRLPEEHKKDIYSVLIWIIREFTALRQKNNLDVGYKRIRLAEYIAILYALKLSSGMYTFSDEGKKIQISTIEKRIFTFPDYLLKMISSDSLISGRNNVNDLDAFYALKYSYKGKSGLGESKTNSIPKGYRQVHMSHIGRLDLDSSTANDPGLTGLIAPMAEITDHYFSDWSEPDTWRDSVRELMSQYRTLKNTKSMYDFRESIGLTIDEVSKGILDESISQIDSLVPTMMDVDESMITISKIKPFEILPEIMNE